MGVILRKILRVLIDPLTVFWTHRRLILNLTKREIESRYRGSILGVIWTVLTPILMLLVYTFVFSVVFKAKWGDFSGDTTTEFALIVFSGLIVFNIFAECFNRAPSVVTDNPNFVKKVIFPLEVQAWSVLLVALFGALVSTLVWLVCYFLVNDFIPIKILLLPIVLLPLGLISLGIIWVFSSVGVYIRDLRQVVTIFTSMLIFLSPVFYPVSALPPRFQQILILNPLTSVLENVRNIAFFDLWPTHLLIQLVSSWVVAVLGLRWFKKTKPGFADVM